MIKILFLVRLNLFNSWVLVGISKDKGPQMSSLFKNRNKLFQRKLLFQNKWLLLSLSHVGNCYRLWKSILVLGLFLLQLILLLFKSQVISRSLNNQWTLEQYKLIYVLVYTRLKHSSMLISAKFLWTVIGLIRLILSIT